MSGNMYENVKTINFLAGKCPHGCIYCSTKSFRYDAQIKKYSGELRLDENAFKKNLGKGNIWFVCAQNDLFATEVHEEFIFRIYEYIEKFPQNEYWFQSKNPSSMLYYARNPYIYGTTIESNRNYGISPGSMLTRSAQMFLFKPTIKTTFVTIEPIVDFDLEIFVEQLKMAKPNWINIGADSKRSGLEEPSKAKVLDLISELKKFTEVREKSNLNRLLNNH